jgi:protoheme IX farnesyltransferase
MAKPRLNFLVLVTTAVGFYMGARGTLGAHWVAFVHTMLGTALTAAGASVLNQYVERAHDHKMRRTANRALPSGRVRPVEALTFGVLLTAGGVLYLALAVSPLVAALGALTHGSYVFVYTPMKRWTTLCTVVGAIPGAIPPMMGWAAASGEVTPPAWALFGILFFWQLPHFLAIAILYRDDYAAGGFKMLPVVDREMTFTGQQIVLWGLALIPVSLTPVMMGIAGVGYFAAAVLLGLGFWAAGVRCAWTRGARPDARRLFLASIIYLPLLVAAMVAGKV